MLHNSRWRFAAFGFLLLISAAQAENVSQECRTDLEVLPGFLLENDAGGADAIVRLGQPAFDRALSEARSAVAVVATEDDCSAVIRAYLHTWRAGHLIVQNISSSPTNASEAAAIPDQHTPRYRSLSSRTALITVPSFHDRYGSAIAKVVARNAQNLARHNNLIIDVRGNGGGSDSSFEPLMALTDANPRFLVGAEYLATPANIAGSEAICGLYALDSTTCRAFMKPVLQAMRAGQSGDYVLPANETRSTRVEPRRVLIRPKRVAVLIDKGCASTCEEFLINVRQSFKVKLFGRTTFGAIDYGNLRPYELPSGKRRLFYATSRSLRLPAQPFEPNGIAPDQFLPAPAADAFELEIETVRRVIEGTHVAHSTPR